MTLEKNGTWNSRNQVPDEVIADLVSIFANKSVFEPRDLHGNEHKLEDDEEKGGDD